MSQYREPVPEIDVNEFRKVVQSRRSVRKFTDESIPDAVLRDCLDMAILAPNSSNLQPWEFIVVKSEDKRRKLARICLGQAAASTAPVLIAVVARQDNWRNTSSRILREWPDGKPPKIVRDYYGKLTHLMYTQGPLNVIGRAKKAAFAAAGLTQPVPRGPNTHADMDVWAAKSCALAAAHLMLALRAHGFDSCPMEGFDEKRAKRLLKLPGERDISMIVAAGRRQDGGVFHARYRLPYDEVVSEL